MEYRCGECVLFRVVCILCLATSVVSLQHQYEDESWKPSCKSWKVVSYSGPGNMGSVLSDLSHVIDYVAKRTSSSGLLLPLVFGPLGYTSMCKNLDDRNCFKNMVRGAVGKKNFSRGKKNKDALKRVTSAEYYDKFLDPEQLEAFFVKEALPFSVICESASLVFK